MYTCAHTRRRYKSTFCGNFAIGREQFSHKYCRVRRSGSRSIELPLHPPIALFPEFFCPRRRRVDDATTGDDDVPRAAAFITRVSQKFVAELPDSHIDYLETSSRRAALISAFPTGNIAYLLQGCRPRSLPIIPLDTAALARRRRRSAANFRRKKVSASPFDREEAENVRYPPARDRKRVNALSGLSRSRARVPSG